MNDAPSLARLDGSDIWWAAVLAWTAAGTALLLVFPMAAPVVLPLSAAAPLASQWLAQQHWPMTRPSPIILALGSIGIYLLLNASWSLSPETAYPVVGLFFIVVVVLYFTLDALDQIDNVVLRALALGVVAGMVIGGAVLCIEVVSGQGIRRLIAAYIPMLQPNPRHMGSAMGFAPYLINRSVGVFTLLFWPTVLIIDRLDLSRRQKIWLLIAIAPGVAAIFRSEHGTSKVAFIGAAALFGFYRLYPVLARRLTLAGWTAAVLLVIPMASLVYGGKLYQARWLPPSAQHRVVIWGYTSEQIAKAPLLGAGIGTGRALSNIPTTKAPGSDFNRSTGWHSHNAYLQVWYETGAVGALLLLGLGLLILRALARATFEVQPHLNATFMACALLAASAFSIWAPWLLASFAIVCIATAIGVALPASAASSQAGAGA